MVLDSLRVAVDVFEVVVEIFVDRGTVYKCRQKPRGFRRRDAN